MDQAMPSTTTPAVPMQQPVTPAVPVNQSPTNPTPPSQQMKKSSNTMVLVIILALVILAVAGWFLYQIYMNKSASNMYKNTNKTYQVTPTIIPSPTVGAVKSGDSQIDKQSSEIDEGMMKVENDVKGVDSGLNDKPDNLGS